MTQTEPVVEDTTPAEDTTEPVVEDTTTEPEKSDAVDYKAIAEAEAKRAEAATKAAADAAFKLRELKRGGKDEEEVVDDEKPLTRAEASKMFQEREARELIAKHVQGDQAEAALLFWKNRVVPTGNLEQDVMFAIGGLNYNSVIAKNSELRRALQGKETVTKDGTQTVKDPTGTSETTLSSQDAQTIKASGMKWDGTKRLYSKKLKDGKTFYFDPKTKKRWKGE